MAPSATIATEIYTLKDYHNHNIVTVNHGGEQNNNGALAAKLMVQSALHHKINTIDVDTCLPGEEDAFYVADLGEVYRQHLRWKINLGSVKPYYGMALVQKTEELQLTPLQPLSAIPINKFSDYWPIWGPALTARPSLRSNKS